MALATGNAQRFDLVMTQYEKAKDITQRRIYLETMEMVLKNMSKILIDSKTTGGAVPYLSLNDLLKRPAAEPAAPATSGGTNP